MPNGWVECTALAHRGGEYPLYFTAPNGGGTKHRQKECVRANVHEDSHE